MKDLNGDSLRDGLRRRWCPGRRNGVLGEGLSGDDILEGEMSGDDILGDGMSGDDLLGERLSGDDILGDGLNGDDVLEDGMSGDDVLEDGMNGDVSGVTDHLSGRNDACVQSAAAFPHPQCGTTPSLSLSLCTAVVHLRKGEPVWSSGSPRQ